MFNITYLSNDKNRVLRKLQDRLATATDPRVRNETDLLIQEVLAEAKPYQQTDMYEASELRNQLMEKIMTLQGLKKPTETLQYYLREVDFHIQTLQMAEKLKESKKMDSEEGPTIHDRATSINDLNRDRRKKKAVGRTRWVIGMDDDESDP